MACNLLDASRNQYMGKVSKQQCPLYNRHKILPHGIPSMIYLKPHKWGALYFKVNLYPISCHFPFEHQHCHRSQILVPAHLIDATEAKFAPPNNPVFQFIPPLFDTLMYSLYAAIGLPAVSSQSLWDVYCALPLKFLPTW